MTLYRCAIAPLDQSSTSLGWSPGLYLRSGCASGIGNTDCGWQDKGLQFLADPGTPVVAPFPVQVVSTNPLMLRATVDLNWPFGRAWDIKVSGVTPAVPAGAQLDKGALLGRVAAGQRGARWVLWGSDDVFRRTGDQSGIETMFSTLGLEIVGAALPGTRGYDRTPNFGGRLLARSAGPAGGSCVPAGALHGLGAYGLGSAAPTGYVDPQSSVYGRYGTSSQSDTSVPNPHHNTSPSPPAAAGGGLLGLGLLAGLAWWLTKG